MAYCSKCGKEVHDDAEICVHCGCRIKEVPTANDDTTRLIRFLLTFFLGFIGSFIINHSGYKPAGYTCRTKAYFFLSIVTFGIYALVASICNFTFDSTKEKNIGYYKN